MVCSIVFLENAHFAWMNVTTLGSDVLLSGSIRLYLAIESPISGKFDQLIFQAADFFIRRIINFPIKNDQFIGIPHCIPKLYIVGYIITY